MKIIVCGGHAFGRVASGPTSAQFKPKIERASHERAFLSLALDDLHRTYKFTEVHVGREDGVDRLAWQWAVRLGLGVVRYEAQWDRMGVNAGYDRNTRMLEGGKPDLVVVFPGGPVTADMVSKAQSGAIKVLQVDEEQIGP